MHEQKNHAQQIKNKKLNEIYIKENPLLKQVEMRAAWFALMIFSPIVLLVGILKAFFELITGQPKKSSRSLFTNSLISFALLFSSLIGIFYPSYFRKNISSRYTSVGYIRDIRDQFKQNRLNQFVIDRVWVPTQKGTIDTVFIQCKTKQTTQYTLQFCANGYAYQEIAGNLFDECEALQRNVVAFNYPGNIKHETDYLPSSTLDLINAGIAEVYYLAKTNDWTNKDVSTYLQLYGHSIGGAVALQVAAYFKEKYNMDIPVHADRSFSSISALLEQKFYKQLHLPKWVSKVIFPLLLSAGGGWEFDSIAACKKLHPKMIHYYNLGHRKNQKVTDHIHESLLLKESINKLIYGRASNDADPIIPDGATLADGLSDMSSCKIFKGINEKPNAHLVFSDLEKNDYDHNAYKDELYDANHERDFLHIYQDQVNSHINVEEKNQQIKPS